MRKPLQKTKKILAPLKVLSLKNLKNLPKTVVTVICLKNIMAEIKTTLHNLAAVLFLGPSPNLAPYYAIDSGAQFVGTYFPSSLSAALPSASFPWELVGKFFSSFPEPPQPPLLLGMIVGILGVAIAFICWLEDEYLIRITAVICSIAYFISWVDAWYNIDPFNPHRIFDLYALEIPLMPEYQFYLTFGMDGISFSLILLTTFVIPICLMGSGPAHLKYKQFALYIIIIEIFLVLCFCAKNILFFYIFFECVLIPMYVIIGSFGERIRKNKASFYFFLYTLFGSFFLLFGILYVFVIYGTFDYDVLRGLILKSDFVKDNKYIFLLFFIPFAVKIPMYPFHLWLPEAHVEAPTTGSVILASLLLKLGGYGLIRFVLALFPAECVYFQPFVVVIAIAGVIYGAFSAIRQSDLKRIIAYSSIAHMNLAVLGLFSFTQQGIEGAIYLMLGHGIVSAALFLCVGNISDRHHTRSLKYFGGLVKVMPLFSIFLFIFTLANMSFPGTSNFVGEFLVFVAMYEQNIWMAIFASTGIIFSAVYSIWLFNRMSFGTLKTTENGPHFADLNRSEFYIFISLLIPMLLLGVYSGCVTNLIGLPVSDIVALYT